MKDKIKKWWVEFEKDLIFNIIMLFFSTMLVMSGILISIKMLMMIWNM